MIEPQESLKRLASFNKFAFFWTLFGLLIHILSLISGIFIFAFLVSNPLDEQKYWFAPYTFYFLIPIAANNLILSLLGIAQLRRFHESVKCFRYVQSLQKRIGSRAGLQIDKQASQSTSETPQNDQNSDTSIFYKGRSRISSATEKSGYQL